MSEHAPTPTDAVSIVARPQRQTTFSVSGLHALALAVVLLSVWSMAASSARAADEAPSSAGQRAAEPEADLQPLPLSMDAIQPRDRVLFVGDELTQQMFYTRAVAAALLRLRPQDDLRFFNGGRDGATAATTIKWIDSVMTLCEPTVVMICLGLNDAPTPPLTQETLTQYQRDLAALVDHVRQHSQVRLVVLMSPPPIESGLTAELKPENPNHVLWTLGDGVRAVAARRQTGFIDLFPHLSKVYLGTIQHAGAQQPLTLGGRLPSELGHIVLASIVLQGLGVSGSALDAAGWSPLIPREMAQVRPVLALPSVAPTPMAAQDSREVYLQLLRFDEQFFRLWRLAGRPRRSSPDPVEVKAQAEEAWSAVRRMVTAPQ